MGAVTDPIAALDALAANPSWRWPWRYRWRSRQLADGTWSAEVQAGYFDDQWRSIGATPRWGGTGPTEADALSRAASCAIDHWSGDLRKLRHARATGGQ